MARRLRISFEEASPGGGGGGRRPRSFGLSVPAPDVPATDLVTCVRERLAIPAAQPLYFTLEREQAPSAGAGEEEADVVPLSAALPDGACLRLHTAPPRCSGPPALEPVPAGERALPPAALGLEEAAAIAGSGAALGLDSANRRALLAGDSGDGGGGRRCRRCCSCLRESGEVPPPKEINTDLANERTLLAWVRTGLAVIRTVFSFATLNGLSRGFLTVDVGVTIMLAVSGVASLLIGWQRWAVVRTRGVLRARRLSIWPVFSVFVVVAGVCCVAALLRQPRRLSVQHAAAEEWWAGSGEGL